MAAGAPRLEVYKESLWRNVCVEGFWDPEFSHLRILDDGEDKLISLAPRCFVGATVGALGLVRHSHARAYNGRGIFIDHFVVGSDV